MRSRFEALFAAACSALLMAACGAKIGDACSLASDCSQEGGRTCDTASPGGYCTVEACDFGTCPSEATCVRFFPGADDSRPCAEQGDCAVDEVCTVAGTCASRRLERRFCMVTCSGDGDCREGYECRDLERMRLHGGEPVPDPGVAGSAPPDTAFCAAARPCLVDGDCDDGDSCDPSTRYCRRG